jgi:anti-anti-sigma factor
MQSLATRAKSECKMAFQVERRPHFLLVAIKGEASFDQAELISTHLLQIPLEAYSLVVLDLAQLTLLSSQAIGALLMYRWRLRRHGLEVTLANVPAQVCSALKFAELWEEFETVDLDDPGRRLTMAAP